MSTTLYDRLGGHDGITRITRELMKNHLAILWSLKGDVIRV